MGRGNSYHQVLYERSIYKLSGAATPLGQGQQMVLIISNEISSPKCLNLQGTA